MREDAVERAQVRNHESDSDNAAVAEKLGQEQDLKLSLRKDQDRALWRVAKEGQTKTNKFEIGMQRNHETALKSYPHDESYWTLAKNFAVPQGTQHQIDLALPHQQVYAEAMQESALSRGQRPPVFVPDYVNNDFFAEEKFNDQKNPHRVFDAAGNGFFVGVSPKFSFSSKFLLTVWGFSCVFILLFLFIYHHSAQTRHREPLLTEKTSLV